MSLKRELTLSVLVNWAGAFVSYLIAFLATPIIVHSLGNEKYGVWSLAISLTGYYGIMDFGIRSTMVKFFSEFAAKGEKNNCNSLTSTVSVIYIFIAIIVEVITFTLALFSNTIFKISPDLANTLFTIILIIGSNLSLSFLFKAFSGVIVAMRRFDIQNAIMITTSIFRTLFLIFFLKMGYGLISMALIVMIFDIATGAVFVYLAFRVFPHLKIHLNYFSTELIKKVYSFTGYTFLIHFSRIINERSGQIIIGMFLGVEFVVYYAISESLVRYARKLPKGIVTTLLPFASHLDAKGDTLNLNRILYIIPKYMITFSLYVFFVFFQFGKEGIMLWIGSGYESCHIILVILILSETVLQSTNVIGQVVVGMGKNRSYALISVFGTVLLILLSIIFMKLWGVTGVAIGTFSALFISRGILFPFVLSRAGVFSISKFFFQSFLPPVISFGVFYFCYFIFSNLSTLPTKTLFGLISTVAISSTLYMAICYKIVLKEIIFKKNKFRFQV